MAYKNVDQRREASRRHYLANKRRYIERNARYRLAIQDYVRALKEASPCRDCGMKYPYYVMDFDHINEDDKLNDINYLSSTGRIGALKKEILKCELVCANCHRIRTHSRQLVSARSSVD